MRYDLVTTTYLPGHANAVAKAAAEAGPATGLAGYWVTEIGTLNQTVELWSHPRPSSAGDAPLERVSRPLTGVVGPVAPAVSAGIYEMRHYRLRPGVAPSWVAIFTAALPAREKYSKIVALLASEPGEPDEVIHIWNYPDLNTRASVRAAALKDPAWQDFLGKSRGQQMVVRQDVSILLPAAHSPLK